MTKELSLAVTKPLTALGCKITRNDVARIVDGLANVPTNFRSADLAPYVCSSGQRLDYAVAQEVLNRLFQRWRKMGLCEFGKGGYWRLPKTAWDIMQAAPRSDASSTQ